MIITDISEKSKILLDSDGLVATHVPVDVLHDRAGKIFNKLIDTNAQLFCLDLVLFESATVISYKYGHRVSIDFVAMVFQLNLRIIEPDNDLKGRTWESFLTQEKKGTSFVDCANLAFARREKLDGIFSFDQFYPKNVRIQI